MKHKLRISFTFLLLLFLGSQIQAQEVAKERTTKYIFHLNAIKHQDQVDGVSAKTKQISGVTTCELNWLQYQMEVVVKEGGSYGSFPMEDLKAILNEHHVQLKNFTKETLNP
ncbi:MAG: hypothetical protein KDD41_08220 [Flavobacteriales bacterium]|nr:hypothetical protein [Flavobacteriales bacterium]